MKTINILKKILRYSFYLLLIFSFIYLVYFINTQDPYKKKIRQDLKSIVKKNTFSKHLLNDYREQFLPNTQFINVNIKKIDLDFLNLSGCYFGSCYSFFLEEYNENLIIADRKGVIKTIPFNSLNKEKIEFTDIENNLNFEDLLDIYINEKTIYVTGKKKVDEIVYLELVKGELKDNSVNFESVIELASENCIRDFPHVAGKVQTYNKDKNKLLLSVNQGGWSDNPSLDNLSGDSICGKTLLINPNDKTYEIFTSGHRNNAGLYVDDNVILSTEHGPYGGDEINSLVKGNSYGWPLVSYGEKYKRDRNETDPNYKKSHLKNGFVEPIFSFVPAIGISEIIKLPNNFSNLWQDNFLLASLNGKYLYRLKFDTKFTRLIYYEPIYIGDRIRDIIYNKKSNKILLALELEGALGIIDK